jgi:hypothetical protein
MATMTVALESGANSYKGNQLPDTNNTRDLGSTQYKWRNLYTTGIWGGYSRNSSGVQTEIIIDPQKISYVGSPTSDPLLKTGGTMTGAIKFGSVMRHLGSSEGKTFAMNMNGSDIINTNAIMLQKNADGVLFHDGSGATWESDSYDKLTASSGTLYFNGSKIYTSNNFSVNASDLLDGKQVKCSGSIILTSTSSIRLSAPWVSIGSQLLPSGTSIQIGDTNDRFEKIWCNRGDITSLFTRQLQAYSTITVSASEGMVIPQYDGGGRVGIGAYRWGQVSALNLWYQNSCAPSDIELKENIIPLTSEFSLLDGSNITSKDMFDFIKSDVDIYSYNYKDMKDTEKIGIIANELVDTPVGDKFIFMNEETGKLAYSMDNYIFLLTGAFKEEIRQREEQIQLLEERIAKLEKKL